MAGRLIRTPPVRSSLHKAWKFDVGGQTDDKCLLLMKIKKKVSKNPSQRGKPGLSVMCEPPNWNFFRGQEETGRLGAVQAAEM